MVGISAISKNCELAVGIASRYIYALAGEERKFWRAEESFYLARTDISRVPKLGAKKRILEPRSKTRLT